MATNGDDIRIAIGYEHDQKSAEQVAGGAAKIATAFEYVDDAATTAKNAVAYFEKVNGASLVEPFAALPPVIESSAAKLATYFDYVEDAAQTAKNAVAYFAAGGTTPVVEPFEVLPNTVRRATQSLEGLETQQRQNVVTTEQLNKSNDGIIDGLYAYARANESAEQALARLRREQEQAGRTLGESEAEIEQAIRQQNRQPTQVGVSRRAFDSTSQVLNALGFDEGGRLVNFVGDLGAAALSATPLMLGATVALGGIGLVSRVVTDNLDDLRAQYRRTIEAQTSYFEALQSGTTDVLARQRETLRDQLLAQQAELSASLQELQSGRFQILGTNLESGGENPLLIRALSIEYQELEGRVASLTASTSGLELQIEALDSALNSAAIQQRSYVQDILSADQMTREEREAAIQQMRNEAELLTQVLTEIDDQVVSEEITDRIQQLGQQVDFLSGIYYTSADAAAALAEQEQELEEARKRQLDAYRRYMALELQIQEMDAAARKERREAIQREIDLARSYLSESVGLDPTVVASVEAEIALLEQELNRLNVTANTTADALNRVTDAQGVNPTVGGRGDALSTYYDRLQDFTERVTDSADDLLEANKTLTDAQAELADAQRDLAELDTGYRADQLAAAEEANADLEKIQQDHEAAITEITSKGEADRQRILRQSNALISNAYAQRDALAAYLAIQNRNQQLADQKDQETEALAQSDAAAKKQRDTAEANYRKALQDLQRRYDEEKVLRDRAVAQAKADVTNAEYNLKYIREQYNNLRIAAEYNTQNQVMSAVQQGGAAIVQTWGLVARQSVEAISAAFSQNMANQRQALAAGAVGAASARGNTVTINVAAAQLKTIDARSREQALRVMNGIFDQMGIRT